MTYPSGVAAGESLVMLIGAVGAGDHGLAQRMLERAPQLASARVERSEEFFVEACRAQVYEGDTALHAAAFAYDTTRARQNAPTAHVSIRSAMNVACFGTIQ